MTEQMIKGACQAPGLRPVRVAGQAAVGGLLLAGLGWTLRAAWEIRLALAGEPASGPPDQGNGVHRPLDGLENAYHVVTSVANLAALVCAVSFLSWLVRVRDNARTLSGRPPRYAGVWVYLGWIVPVVNFWFPRGLVADAFRASAPGRKVPFTVNLWWGLWLAGTLSGVGLVYKDSTDEVIARAYDEVWPLLASDAALVGAAVAGAFVVRAVTRAQTAAPRPA
ncbi:DUF4328 domain-containing protein [Streptomyces pyxinicus]